MVLRRYDSRVDYSFAEQFFLGFSELILEAHHSYRDRPRAFWGAWTVAFSAAALVLLARRGARGEPGLPRSSHGGEPRTPNRQS